MSTSSSLSMSMSKPLPHAPAHPPADASAALLALTMGDACGIGPETLAKAFAAQQRTSSTRLI